jgi:hypothetical protein
MFLLLTIPLIAGITLGALVGRWSMLLAIAPLAVLIATEGELEGSLNTWVAFVASVAFAVGVALGIALHRRQARLR